jgi:hypothetical protein
LAWHFAAVCFSFSSSFATKEREFAGNFVGSELDRRTSLEVDVRGRTRVPLRSQAAYGEGMPGKPL